MENKYERRLDIIRDDSLPERGEFGKKFENKEEKELLELQIKLIKEDYKKKNSLNPIMMKFMKSF